MRDGEVLARWGLSGGHHVIDVGGGIVVDDASAVLRLDPARATGPDPEHVVSGTARLESEAGARVAGLRVRVGDEIAITDESGAFSARVRARGGVHAWIEGDPPSPCDRYERVFVPLGAGEPLTLRRLARECLERRTPVERRPLARRRAQPRRRVRADLESAREDRRTTL